MQEKDNRLFSVNSPIGRVWYYINMFLLGVLFTGTHIGIKNYILPGVNPSYESIVNFLTYFIYFILVVTFFILIDRRTHDICGDRNASSYLILSKITGFFASLFALGVVSLIVKFKLPESFYPYLMVLAFLFAFFIFVLGLIPGKLSSE